MSTFKFHRLAIAGLAVLVLQASLIAQEIVQIEYAIPPQEGAAAIEVQDFVVGTTFSYDMAVGDTLFAHPMIRFSSDPNQLINQPQVRKNLELDQDQIKELRSIQKEFSKRMSDGMNEVQANGKFDSKRWTEIYKQIQKERKDALGAVLLPHQSKRLKQIATQMKMKNQGDANTLVSKEISEELGISKKQKDRIKSRAAEIKEELERDIAKLKEAARQKLLKELSREQRTQLENMMGEKFEIQAPKPPRRNPQPESNSDK